MLKHSRGIVSGCAIGFATFLSFGLGIAAHAETTLHAFAGGNDGNEPGVGLIADQAGNLYGTTASGGGGSCNNLGCGTVFKLAPDGTETILYSFAGGSDGSNPEGQLIFDNGGILYGTTAAGGSTDSGTVFKLAPDGTETVLYAFQNGTDGDVPQGNLVIDQDGNLYGTTDYGGNTPGCGGRGCGTVFKVTPDDKESILYTFQNGGDGSTPVGGLISDGTGNLYGTGLGGGTGCSCGVVFKLTPDGTETVLYSFQGGSDGMFPVSTLAEDGMGNFYGTTQFGGNGGEDECCGTVFRIAPDLTEKVLYAFRGGNDAEAPSAGLVLDAKGNLYGTSYFGGGPKCGHTGHVGCGTVFKVTPGGRETILYSFARNRGTYSTAPLILQGKVLYGTTTAGGPHKDGVVFSIRK